MHIMYYNIFTCLIPKIYLLNFQKIWIKREFRLAEYHLKHVSVFLSIQTKGIHKHPKLSNSFKIRKDSIINVFIFKIMLTHVHV